MSDRKITIGVIVRPELDSPHNHLAECMTEEQILELLEKAETNLWLWCSVEVRAIFFPFYGSAYLGACSYESEEEFMKGGYYEQLKTEAMDDLRAAVDFYISAVEEFDAVGLETSELPFMAYEWEPENSVSKSYPR